MTDDPIHPDDIPAPLPPAAEPDGDVLVSEADDPEDDEELEKLLADEAAIDAPADDETPEEAEYPGGTDPYADDDSGSLSRLVDLEDPEVIAVLNDTDIEAPDGEEFFIVKGGATASKSIHRVANNHVTRTFESWAFSDDEKEAGRKTESDTVERKFKFLDDDDVELLLEAGFAHCKVCARKVERVAQMETLTPLIEQFRELAAEVAKAGVEVRLVAYNLTEKGPRAPQGLWNSLDMVREQC